MSDKIFHAMSLNPDAVGQMFAPHKYLNTTGHERLDKTVNRIMVAGLNLYLANRNGDYQDQNPDIVDGMPVAPSKYFDEKSAMMRMREIQARLRRKVNAQPVIELDPAVTPTPEAEKTEV